MEHRLAEVFTQHKVTVVVDPDLVAKAAAGPTRIRLRQSTCFSEYDLSQLLEHEAFVHSLTSLNGRNQTNLGSLGLNSPRITATQEGLAVFSELVTGSIDIMRMKRISLRILAIDMALRGANFIEVFTLLPGAGPDRDGELHLGDARIPRRAHRRPQRPSPRTPSTCTACFQRAHLLPLGLAQRASWSWRSTCSPAR
jgi:hypothetical protein